MRLRLVLAYVGTRYSGWQIQEKPDPPPTIQGTLEWAMRKISGVPVRIYGSGRTDAGVHAHGQVAHCDVPDAKAGLHWRQSLNALLPSDIRVIQAAPAPADFHARKNALNKTYMYQFWQERAFVPPHLIPFVWTCGPVAVNTMRAALPYLLGQHDFAGLRNTGTDVESSLRTIQAADLCILPCCEHFPEHAPMLRLTVTADGFLKQMVRNIAGLLVACGKGKIPPQCIPALLAAHDRQAVPAVTAPPQGLTLVRVTYPEQEREI